MAAPTRLLSPPLAARPSAPLAMKTRSRNSHPAFMDVRGCRGIQTRQVARTATGRRTKLSKPQRQNPLLTARTCHPPAATATRTRNWRESTCSLRPGPWRHMKPASTRGPSAREGRQPPAMIVMERTTSFRLLILARRSQRPTLARPAATATRRSSLNTGTAFTAAP